MTNTTDGPKWNNDLNETSTWAQEYHQILSPFLKAHDMIWIVGGPIIFVFGTFGNVMIILIMRRLSESSVGIFFQVLSWCDQLVLTTGLVLVWLKLVFGVQPIENLSTWSCKVYTMLIPVMGVLSPWMLVALTMQRAASVLWPHRVSAVWTKKKVRTVAGILIAVATLIHSHFLYGMNLDKKLCREYALNCCPIGVSETYTWFLLFVWPWLDLIEFSLLPFLLLIISNGVLLWKLDTSVRTSKRLPVQQATQDARQRKVSSLTVTLLVVSVSFFLLTTPISVYFITRPLVLTPAVSYQNPVLVGQYLVLWAAGNFLWTSNCGINFYLYCLTGSRFRAEFLNIMREVFSVFHRTGKAADQTTPSTVTSSSAALTTDTANGSNSAKRVTDSDF